MTNVALRIRALNPDLVIPSSYYGEFVLLARTMQQHIRPKGIYSVLNGAASNFRFVKEFPEAANGVMDCNHWADPRKPATIALRKAAEAAGKAWAYNIPLNYSCVKLVADAIERAGSADRDKVVAAFAERRILVAPGVFDALTATIATDAGFEALYLSGAAIAYTKRGRRQSSWKTRRCRSAAAIWRINR